MKTCIATMILSLPIATVAFGQVSFVGPHVGVGYGRPYLQEYTAESPSNFSEVFAGYRLSVKGSIFSYTPKVSVKRYLITSNHYFKQQGEAFYFTEVPLNYSTNRLQTYVATFGIGVSVTRKLTKNLGLEIALEPQIGKSISNKHFYHKDGVGYKTRIENNPFIFSSLATIWLTRPCNCSGRIMFGPSVLLQNGAYQEGKKMRFVTPSISLALQL